MTLSTWRRVVGLDFINTALVVAGSSILVIFVGELTGSGELALGSMALCLLGFGILRHYALRALPGESETSGSWRMADVEARLVELEAMSSRIAELEERVDFSERLLAERRQPAQIERK
jgi:hypothetical protein